MRWVLSRLCQRDTACLEQVGDVGRVLGSDDDTAKLDVIISFVRLFAVVVVIVIISVVANDF